ncbi:hypothetical protein B0H19DRAFT_1082559 [Mycena capillaripes]|nr:hypothetical protein B0H19DRAFT_1082559 [Mycena capillaripes]
MLSAFTLGLAKCGPTTALCTVMDVQIMFGLIAATNIALSALTGELKFLVNVVGYCGSGEQPPMLVLTPGSAAVTIRPWELCRLESGAIYCIGALIGAVSIPNQKLYDILYGIGSQAINIIPTFTIVYIGLNNTADRQYPYSIESTSALRLGVAHPFKPMGNTAYYTSRDSRER